MAVPEMTVTSPADTLVAQSKIEAPSLHFRPDIQGLRAVAVIAVVMFHFWPNTLSGGYVGVDVFFVISGYLITGLLAREMDNSGTISIWRFYSRRIRRLVPCANFVLAVVAVFSFFVLPATQWRNTSHGILASALYVENWDLVHKSANYLNAFFPPTPVQHFWSLSVEGQFYLVWPLVLILAGKTFLTRKEHGHSLIFFAAITISLFLFSLVICFKASVPAYFSTFTRLWELALGGVIVYLERILPSHYGRHHHALGWLGVIAILLASVLFSNHTLFPGYAALLPTMGAAVLIFSGSSQSGLSPNWLLARAPARYIGDISYSIYLWHWPIVIFAKQIWRPDIGLVAGGLMFGLCIALSHLTWTFIEKPFHRPSEGGAFFARNAFHLAFGFTALSIVCGTGLLTYLIVLQRSELPIIGRADQYPGAAALRNGFSHDAFQQPFIPSALTARDDRAESEKDGCEAPYAAREVKECSYGELASPLKVALIGDSHAEQWLPALTTIAGKRRLAITVYAKAHCAFAAVTQFLFEEGRIYTECSEWNRSVLKKLAESLPALVLTSEVNGYQVVGAADAQDGARRMVDGFLANWKQLESMKIRVVAVADTPFMPFDVPDCLARRRATVETCSAPRSAVLKPVDPLVEAASRDEVATLIDMNNLICTPTICPSVVGNVLVYQDSNHLTATYAKTLGPMLDEAIKW